MKNFPKKLYKKLVVVDWYDIATSGGWSKNTTEFTPLPIQSVGWVAAIYYNPSIQMEAVNISASQGSDAGFQEFNQHISIPTGVITKVTEIKVKEKVLKKKKKNKLN